MTGFGGTSQFHFLLSLLLVLVSNCSNIFIKHVTMLIGGRCSLAMAWIDFYSNFLVEETLIGHLCLV